MAHSPAGLLRRVPSEHLPGTLPVMSRTRRPRSGEEPATHAAPSPAADTRPGRPRTTSVKGVEMSFTELTPAEKGLAARQLGALLAHSQTQERPEEGEAAA